MTTAVAGTTVVTAVAMTERGARARWGTAGLVAPAAAALFAGVSSWALQHPPVAPTVVAGGPAAQTQAAAQAPTMAPADRRRSALRRQLTLQQQHLVALERRVTHLRAQTRALELATAKLNRQPPPAYNVPAGPVYASSAVVPAPSQQPQYRTAAPATQATTRASGARP